MTSVEVQIPSSAFNEVYKPHLTNYAREQIFYGGASSGKSVFLTQRCIMDILAGGRNYLVCRQVGRTIRRSVYTEIIKTIRKWGIGGMFSENKTELTITCVNGYQILFAGLDDPEKLKSITPAIGVLTDVWVEEATETNMDSLRQLRKRQRGGDSRVPKRLTLSFNPILRTHPIYKEYFEPNGWGHDQTEYNADGLTILKTWYVHNKFLTPEDVSDLQAEPNKYFYDVYTLGNWGVIGNQVFSNWRVEDLSAIKGAFSNLYFGLDFGFSQDPAALICTHYDERRKTIYIFDELYERGMTNDILADAIRPMVGRGVVMCDSAEPKSIAELNNSGITAVATRKGADSVLYGLQWLAQHTIIVDSSCINTQNELQLYQWKTVSGEVVPKPIDRFNHLMDALRYAYENNASQDGWGHSPISDYRG